jgi:hypothetical protein
MAMFPSSTAAPGGIWPAYSPNFLIPTRTAVTEPAALYQGLATDGMGKNFSLSIDTQHQAAPAVVPLQHAVSLAHHSNNFRPSKFQYEQKYFQSLKENNMCHTNVFKK